MTATIPSDDVKPAQPDSSSAVAEIINNELAARGAAQGGFRGLTGKEPLLPLLILFGISLFRWVEASTGQLLLPELADAFGMSREVFGAITLLGASVGFVLTIPIAFYGDRFQHRVWLMLLGGGGFAFFTLVVGVAPAVWGVLLATTAGRSIGQATILPIHNSLMSDYYDLPDRPKVFSFHSASQPIGTIVGAIGGGLLAEMFGWRVPFVVLAVGCFAFVLLGLRLREPVRGHFERQAMGLTDGAEYIEEEPPTLEEAWRLVQRSPAVRRLFFAVPFLFIALFGFGLLANLLYADEFGLGPGARGVFEGIADALGLTGFVIGGAIGTRALRKDPALILRILFVGSLITAFFLACFAMAPNVPLTVIARIGVAISLSTILPNLFTVLSMLLPARARATGFSVMTLYFLPGVPIVLVSLWITGTHGIRPGILFLAPVVILGGLIASTAAPLFEGDLQNVWMSTATRSQMLEQRRAGQLKQLVVRGLDVKYGDVQILFGVDFEVDQGEIVALLGTNGAGKSTLLKAITGVVPASSGAIVFDGRDITSSPPNEIAVMGIGMVPGGQGVFPSLTVGENLKVATWTVNKKKGEDPAQRIEQVLTTFPVLRERLKDPAANLSGGQQQMLALGMAFLSKPSLLVIDELSLGLAPVIVDQLIAVVRAIRDQGTTVIVVEQSVNVALSLAETAYFMEKGEIRFHGPTAELLDRPDVLRSVFLEGAAAHMAADGDAPGNGHQAAASNSVAPSVAASEMRGARVFTRRPGVAPALELHGMSVRFGGIRAVDDVSFELQPGEILGIIGPNGAGKTTLFDLISGFSRGDSGRVLLDGRDLTRLGPDGRARQGLGRSFQDARLFPALTVEETIKVSLERFTGVKDPFNAMLRLPVQQESEFRLQRQVDELIDLMGIESFRTKFVRELSTGSRRVVDLACVLAHRPKVVLLDEPSSGIAQRETEALGPLIHRIRDALDASIVLIEHDMPLITGVADRLLALDQGHVVVQGTASTVLNHPQVVASYLGNRDEAINRSGTRAGHD